MSFPAKYEGRCPACNTKIRRGDECDYSGRRVIHEGCADQATALLRDIFGHGDDDDQDDEPDDEPTVTGLRNHARPCPDCHTEHAGECW